MSTHRPLWGFLVAAMLGTPVAQPEIRVRTELVVLHVSVRDSGHHAVSGLPCNAFAIYEDGSPQDISICAPGTEPLVLGLVIDSSTSMGRYKPILVEAGEQFVRLGNPENDVFVLQFNEQVRNATGAKLFTSDPLDVADAVRNLGCRGKTALFDAIGASIDRAGRSDRLKKVVVLVSDGGDNASTHSFDEVLDRARHANVVFFTIALKDELDRDADPSLLERLARETGGVVYKPKSTRDINAVFERIALELQAGYTLAYVPRDERGEGGYHAIKVTARSPNGRGLDVRTRAGYVMSGSSDAAVDR